jgi:hypothetical protein
MDDLFIRTRRYLVSYYTLIVIEIQEKTKYHA